MQVLKEDIKQHLYINEIGELVRQSLNICYNAH